jgi:hypothetical protein
VVANLAPHLDRPATRHDATFDEGQPVRRVEEQFMPARLRFKRDAEGGIGVDVDRPDRVHLQGYLERHHSLRLGPRGLMTEGTRRCNSGEGVLDHFDPALAVDQGKVDPDIGQKSAGFAAKEFVNRLEDPGNLGWRDMRSCKIMRFAVFDLDNR